MLRLERGCSCACGLAVMEGRILLTRKLLGLLAAGPVAVLAFSLLPQLAFWLLVASPPGDLPAHSPMGWRHVRSFLIDIGVVTAYDLPIAMFVTLVLGLPLWLVAERLGWHGRRGAVRLGALAGLIVFLALFVQMLLDALQVRPEGEYSAFGGWRGDIFVNGWPTALGWVMQAELALSMVAAGVMVGLAAYAAATWRRKITPLP